MKQMDVQVKMSVRQLDEQAATGEAGENLGVWEVQGRVHNCKCKCGQPLEPWNSLR